MSTLSHDRQRARTKPRRRAHNPLAAPLLLFTAAAIAAAGYIALVLWPQWPDAPIAGDAPLPVVVAGVVFNIEPAAIRATVQRHPGTHDRIDLDYVWPSLEPPGTPTRPTLVAPDAKDRLFVTIASGAATLPIADRVRDIYPRYLAAEQSSAAAGLTFRNFRDDSLYKGEDLVFESNAPEHFLARCTRHGVSNQGICMLERRIGDADVTFRFPRDWLSDWRAVAGGIDKLLARLHPGT